MEFVICVAELNTYRQVEGSDAALKMCRAEVRCGSWFSMFVKIWQILLNYVSIML